MTEGSLEWVPVNEFHHQKFICDREKDVRQRYGPTAPLDESLQLTNARKESGGRGGGGCHTLVVERETAHSHDGNTIREELSDKKR